jgi:type I restriction enzyme S subunit
MPATPKYVSDGIPYITSKNVRDGVIDFEEVKYISREDYELISKNRCINKNDLLITMIGTIGEAAFVDDFTEFYGQNLYLVRVDETKCMRKYFFYYLTSSIIKNTLISKRNASSQGYIKAGSIDNLSIPLPSLEEQQRIVDILDRFDALYNDISERLTAEIEARQKQYEYYRDKLLTFKELS